MFEEIGSTPVLEQEDAVWTLPDATGSFRRLVAVPPQEEGYGGFAQASPAAKTVEVYLGSVEGMQASPSLRLTSSAANTDFGSRLVPLSGELGGEEVSLAVTAPSSDLVGGFVYLWTSLPEEDDTETSADLVIGSDSSEFFGTTSGGALGDLNGDGSNAVVVPGDSSVYIFSDLVAGGQSVVLSDASTLVVGVGESRLGTRPAVGDLTGDGYADLFVGSGEGGSQSVLLFQGGTGLGSELSSTDAAIVFEGGDFDMGSVLAIADADGNGVEDLVMGGIDGVVLFYGPLGARTKVEQADAQISGLGEDGRVCFEQLVLLDVNSDSTADLVATCAVVMPSTTEILLGRGP